MELVYIEVVKLTFPYPLIFLVLGTHYENKIVPRSIIAM